MKPIPKIGPVDATVTAPPSKSYSVRALLLAAMSEGTTTITNCLDADDPRYALEAIRSIGFEVGGSFKEGVRIGERKSMSANEVPIFVGNAGTAMRFLTGWLAFTPGRFLLHGEKRMHERPIGDLVDALRHLGAAIEYSGKEGFPPLAIRPGTIRRGTPVRVRGDVSSQYLSALLMAAPLAGSETRVEVEGELISKPYVEITLNLMRRFGVEVARKGWSSFVVPARAYSTPGEIRVEGDASSASYFLAAGAISGLSGGGPVRVEGVGRASIQGDVRFAEVLERMGAAILMGEDWIESAAGTEARARGKLKPLDADLNHIPDAAMTAAVVALFAEGPSTIRNIASWRIKETDRIAAMATELRKLGAAVEEGADSLRVTPPAALKPATIDTYDDHRMAMSFSLAALGGIKVRINDPGCVGKTFPEYFDSLASISRRVSA